MDSNKANTGTFYLTVVLVILTIILVVLALATIGLVYWVWRYPNPALAPAIGGWPPMNGYWYLGLSILLSFCLLLAVSLQIVVARLIRGKTQDALLDYTAKNVVLEQQVKELTDNNDKLERNLSRANSAFFDMEDQAKGLTAQLAEAKRGAENAHKAANQEINQKNEFHKLHNESERKLADLAWLAERASEQGRDISAHVVITKVKPLALNLTGSPRCVLVALTIRNESVFDITIRAKKMSGSLFFKNKPREDPARIQETHRAPIENLEPKKEEILLIEQPLLKSEAETISDALNDEKARFWLGNLKIPISVENLPQQVDAKDLRIAEHQEHIYLNEFGALTLNEHAMTPQDLIQDIDKLPRSERVKVYKAALKEYGASLWRLSEAEQDRDPENPD